MLELSEERIKNDEIELHCYGFSSTQIYLNYREAIDKRLKILMLDLAKFYNDMQKKDPETINQMLFEQYHAFWASSEPALQKFYKEIQDNLALPKNFLPTSFINPQDVFGDVEITKVEKEIQSLEEQYLSETYYLHALAQRKAIIEKQCIPLKNQCDSAAKLLKDNDKKLEHFDILDTKRMERLDKFLDGLDRQSLLECMWAGGKNKAKEKENMSNFMELIEENKNRSNENA